MFILILNISSCRSFSELSFILLTWLFLKSLLGLLPGAFTLPESETYNTTVIDTCFMIKHIVSHCTGSKTLKSWLNDNWAKASYCTLRLSTWLLKTSWRRRVEITVYVDQLFHFQAFSFDWSRRTWTFTDGDALPSISMLFFCPLTLAPLYNAAADSTFVFADSFPWFVPTDPLLLGMQCCWVWSFCSVSRYQA